MFGTSPKTYPFCFARKDAEVPSDKKLKKRLKLWFKTPLPKAPQPAKPLFEELEADENENSDLSDVYQSMFTAAWLVMLDEEDDIYIDCVRLYCWTLLTVSDALRVASKESMTVFFLVL